MGTIFLQDLLPPVLARGWSGDWHGPTCLWQNLSVLVPCCALPAAWGSRPKSKRWMKRGATALHSRMCCPRVCHGSGVEERPGFAELQLRNQSKSHRQELQAGLNRARPGGALAAFGVTDAAPSSVPCCPQLYRAPAAKDRGCFAGDKSFPSPTLATGHQPHAGSSCPGCCGVQDQIRDGESPTAASGQAATHLPGSHQPPDTRQGSVSQSFLPFLRLWPHIRLSPVFQVPACPQSCCKAAARRDTAGSQINRETSVLLFPLHMHQAGESPPPQVLVPSRINISTGTSSSTHQRAVWGVSVCPRGEKTESASDHGRNVQQYN